jgi:predicted nicotinamide N-methyase
MIDPAAFITTNLRLTPLPDLGDIALSLAHRGSGLARLAEQREGAAPYWAYVWGGGAALARYVLDRPEAVAGRRVLDLGAGSGLVAIAAARSGAALISACDVDLFARAAIALNATANGVRVAVLAGSPLDGPAPEGIDLILAGDVFYDAAVAERMTAFLDRCVAAGVSALIGDPFRGHLPLPRLELLSEYTVADVMSAETLPGNGATRSGVFAWRPGAG